MFENFLLYRIEYARLEYKLNYTTEWIKTVHLSPFKIKPQPKNERGGGRNPWLHSLTLLKWKRNKLFFHLAQNYSSIRLLTALNNFFAKIWDISLLALVSPCVIGFSVNSITCTHSKVFKKQK